MKSYEEYTWWDYLRAALLRTKPERVSFTTARPFAPKLFLFDIEGFEVEVRLNKDCSVSITEAADDLGNDLPLTVGQTTEIINIAQSKVIEF